jgi:hypothetical protein
VNVYRLSHRGVDPVEGEHGGYTYASSKREVVRLISERKDSSYPVEGWKQIKVEISKRGVLSALNDFGGHPDNG